MITSYEKFDIRVVDLKTYAGEPRKTARLLYEKYRVDGKFIYQFTSDVSSTKIDNFVASKLGTSNRIYARKCVVRGIDHETYFDYAEKHHIQGGARSTVRFGLFHGDELVGAIGFVKYEDGYNLNRLIFGNYTVVGGAPKLLAAFRETYRGKIVTYSNNGYSNGRVYKTLGFNHITETTHDMWYVSPEGALINRRILQKKRMAIMFPNFDPTLTETTNAANNGYHVWYGPGTIRWELSSVCVPSIRKKRGITSSQSKIIQGVRVSNGTHHFQDPVYIEQRRVALTAAALNGISNLVKVSVCPHCNKSGKGAVMVRWHFDNCKLKSK
jgi:hypothetical protein